MVGARGRYIGLGRSTATAIELALTHHVAAVRTNPKGAITSVKHVRFGWMSIGDYYNLQKLHDFLPMLTQLVQSGYQLKSRVWGSVVSVQVLGTGIQIPVAAMLISFITLEVWGPGGLQQQIDALNSDLAVQQDVLKGLQRELSIVEMPPQNPQEAKDQSGIIQMIQGQIATVQQVVAAIQRGIATATFNKWALFAAVVLPFGELYLFWHYAQLFFLDVGKLGQGLAQGAQDIVGAWKSTELLGLFGINGALVNYIGQQLGWWH